MIDSISQAIPRFELHTFKTPELVLRLESTVNRVLSSQSFMNAGDDRRSLDTLFANMIAISFDAFELFRTSAKVKLPKTYPKRFALSLVESIVSL
jgi:hypothetical protein